MIILLYNPLSRNGGNSKYIKKIVDDLSKTDEVIAHSLLDIFDVEKFIQTFKKDDKIVVLGGDGTLNKLVNATKEYPITQDIYMFQAGTGNDFLRSLKTKEKMININKYLTDLPVVESETENLKFFNGIGLGLDGLISDLVNNSRFKKNKFNYFRHAIEGFIKYNPVSGTITIDDKEIKENKLWFVSVMNGPYFGGGMKIAPFANRMEKDLDVVLVKNVPKLLLILIFPTIYLGWHRIFKRYITFYKAKNVKIDIDSSCYMQVDGEVYYPVQKVKASVL
jgi:YegS/Rv2252/BmrU family lipid kinase